jgi:hypothetical protein
MMGIRNLDLLKIWTERTRISKIGKKNKHKRFA